MKQFMFIFLICSGFCSAQENQESFFAGEYAYWREAGDFQSVLLEKISENPWRVLIKGRGRTLSLAGTFREGMLCAEDKDGTTYEFRLNGKNELRMRKRYRNYTSPEDIEWVFFRKQ